MIPTPETPLCRKRDLPVSPFHIVAFYTHTHRFYKRQCHSPEGETSWEQNANSSSADKHAWRNPVLLCMLSWLTYLIYFLLALKKKEEAFVYKGIRQVNKEFHKNVTWTSWKEHKHLQKQKHGWKIVSHCTLHQNVGACLDFQVLVSWPSNFMQLVCSYDRHGSTLLLGWAIKAITTT